MKILLSLSSLSLSLSLFFFLLPAVVDPGFWCSIRSSPVSAERMNTLSILSSLSLSLSLSHAALCGASLSLLSLFSLFFSFFSSFFPEKEEKLFYERKFYEFGGSIDSFPSDDISSLILQEEEEERRERRREREREKREKRERAAMAALAQLKGLEGIEIKQKRKR